MIKRMSVNAFNLSFILGTVFLVLFVFLTCGYVYAEGSEVAVPDPCAGSLALLAIPDGPTVAYSACVVPFGHVVLETDFQHAYLRVPGGSAYNYPEAKIRIELPISISLNLFNLRLI